MGVGRTILFACGQLGMMALTRLLLSWVLKFGDGVSPEGEVLLVAAWLGFALLLMRVFDGITDPIAGTVSDRWVRRGGERRTLLLFSFLLPSIGILFVYAPSFAMTPVMRWVLLLVGMLIFFVGYTLYAIPYWSLVEDYGRVTDNGRRVLSNVLGAALLGAVAVVSVISPGLIEKHGYATTAWYFAIPCALLMILPFFGKPKGLKAPVADPNPPGQSPTKEFFKNLREALKHRRFLGVLILFCGSQMALTVITLALPFIAERLLGGSEGDVALIMAPLLGTAIFFSAAGPALSRRFGWEKTIAVATILLALVYAAAAGLGEPIIGSPLTTAMVLFGLGGPMVALLLGLEGEAITDCAAEAGGERVSTYFGVYNFAVKAMNGVATFLTGMLVTYARDNPEGAMGATRAMSIMAGGMLAIGLVLYYAVRPKRAAAA